MPSSVIRAFDFTPGHLDVVFVSGRRYRYLGVPEALYRQMRESPSKGEFFNRAIRDHFPFVRLEGEKDMGGDADNVVPLFSPAKSR